MVSLNAPKYTKNIIILDYIFAVLNTDIQTHSATRLLQRAYLAELRAKVRRLAVASLSTPGPQIPPGALSFPRW